MGNGTFGYRPNRFHLMDEQLHLDPDIERMIQEIDARMAAGQTRNLFLQPDWRMVLPSFQSILDRSTLTTTPATQGTASPGYTPGAGPATPRAGELSDVTKAIYQLPAVQRVMLRVHDEGHQQLRLLRSEWNNASAGERVTMVTMTSLVVGSSVAIVLANRETRLLAFDLIKGHDISVPGVDGLSFKILDRGGAVTAPLGVAGLSGSARLQFPNGRQPDYEISVSFDVMEFVRSQKR